jgi:hypothetical protein
MGGILFQYGRDSLCFFPGRGNWVARWRVKLLRDIRGHLFWEAAYNLVVYTDGKDPEFREVVVESGVVYDGVDAEDFQLENAVNGIGTVEGEVTLPGATDEQFATLSFRQTVNMNEMIEIKALNVLNDSQPEYQTSLPAGNYRIVASSVGYSTVTEDVTVTDEGTTIQHIIF